MNILTRIDYNMYSKLNFQEISGFTHLDAHGHTPFLNSSKQKSSLKTVYCGCHYLWFPYKITKLILVLTLFKPLNILHFTFSSFFHNNILDLFSLLFNGKMGKISVIKVRLHINFHQ